MREFLITLSIDATEWKRYYAQPGTTIHALSECGLRVSLPAARLQRYGAHDGLHGRFRLVIDENNRLERLERLSGPDPTANENGPEQP